MIHKPFSIRMAILALAFAPLFALTLTSCQKGLQVSEKEATSDHASRQGNDGDSANDGPEVSWSQVDLNGKVTQGYYENVPLLQLNPQTELLSFLIPLPPAPGFLGIDWSGSIPNLPGANYQTLSSGSTTLGSSGRTLSVNIPLKFLIKGSNLGLFMNLPNGDPLPYLPTGERRGFSFNLNGSSNGQGQIYVYFAANAAALFLETPEWQFPDELSFLPMPGWIIENSQKQSIGYLKIVPNKGAFPSGVYVAARLSNDIAAIIDNLIRY